MMNAKISLKHDNVHHISMHYVSKFIYNDGNESIIDTLSLISAYGFTPCTTNPTKMCKNTIGGFVVLEVYVNDIIL